MGFRIVMRCFTIQQCKVQICCTVLSVEKGPPVAKFKFLVLGVLCACNLGCSNEPGPIEKAANSPIVSESSDGPVDPPPQTEPELDDKPEGSAGAVADASSDAASDSDEPAGPQELDLKESGISFVAPGSWKRVSPPNKVIEAEFVLPRVDDDEFDGRLTLMSSGGSPLETIATRTGEFKMEPGEQAKQEILSVGGFEAFLVDLRGEWKGPVFQPITPPRADYRMLLLVVPWSERSGFYAKLTGPRTTIAAHEDAFRQFLRSAKITREAPK
jgi:hypothetical protein